VGVRFVETISEAFQLIKAQWVVWALTSLVAIVIYTLLYAPYLAATWDDQLPTDPAGIPAYIGGTLGFSILYGALGYTLIAGMSLMALRQIEGEELSVGMMFSAFRRIAPLAGFMLLNMLMVYLGMLLCIVPGLIVAGLTVPGGLLVTHGNMGPIQAIRACLQKMWPYWLSALGLYLVLSILSGVGALVCLIGVLVSLPMYPIGCAIIYRDVFLNEQGIRFSGATPGEPPRSTPPNW
jgi:hypothetical protein